MFPVQIYVTDCGRFEVLKEITRDKIEADIIRDRNHDKLIIIGKD